MASSTSLLVSQRVSISRAFWEIPTRYQAYPELTKEFLASLALVKDSERGTCITFRLQGRTHRQTVQRLPKWFHFAPPARDHLDYIPEEDVLPQDPVAPSIHRAAFWLRLTRQELPLVDPNPRIGAIIQPTLRIICRVLGHSIFARGQSTLRSIHEELPLLVTMLRPDAQLQRLDLMLHMIKYWMRIPSTGKDGGFITMGSYVIHIATIVGFDPTHYEVCDAAKVINLRSLTSWGWISVTSSQGQPPVYTWKTERNGTFQMPVQCLPINFEHDATWRLHEPPQPPHDDPDQPEDVHIEDVAHAGAEPAGGADADQQAPFTVPQWQWAVMYG